MKKSIFVLVLLTPMIFCSQIFADQNIFGYVDVTEVLQLHPMMRYFDSTSRRFQLNATLSGEDIESRIEENKIQYRAELNKLEEKIKELENKRKELEETYLEKVEHLEETEKNPNDMSEAEKESLNKKKAEFDTDFYNKADEIRKKIYYAQEEINSKMQTSNYTGYLNKDESNQVFSLMLDDVYEALEAVAKKKNISFVFNSSAQLDYKNNAVSIPNCLPEFFDNYNKNPNNAEKEDSPEMDDSERKVRTGGAIGQWLEYRDSSFAECNDRRLTSFVMMGGVDLTPDIIDFIYEKHKIGKDQRDFIQEYFKKSISPKNEISK